MGLWEYLKQSKERKLREDRYILCLDGGGMRGVVAATVLGDIEEKLFSMGDDRPLYSHFDLIAGTSTGGLIALALSAPSSPTSLLVQKQIQRDDLSRKIRKGFDDIYPGPNIKSIVELYLRYGKIIFPRSTSLIQLNLIGQLFNNKYDDGSFVALLYQIFGEMKMADALVPTMVVTYDCLNDKPYLISSYDKSEMSMRVAARATAAAPTYFAPIHITDNQNGERITLIDGGVVANNPVLYAYMEAKKLYPEAKRFHVLSVSTATAPYKLEIERSGTGVIGWLDPSKGTPIYRVYASSQMRTSNEIAAAIGDLDYVRVHGDLSKVVKLDETDSKTLSYMIEAAHDISKENDVAITEFCRPLVVRPSTSCRRPRASTALSSALHQST
ncbi:MAG: patatin-like phospholipase family protein [Sphaerochaetaceae bacterium]|jgi:patatin-like phospholipase/acyl hydrolase|nr:patatin-like phospholipase family protein [Sphaerochaetaceae bacterium]NLO60526.1 patatin-like phospholipase family protein [Spirochaetales bacterium]MDD2405322.1 patatin-like phospholipase family protein [Sphaerochaetaceae bacterium]MDD4258222.1 patatin-like phospholipase family protein [Sphaerochaetaceae bacterium]MDD4763289.1 patatin-like phospholipase family protein [Sphaerochaetaceae bacterium]